MTLTRKEFLVQLARSFLSVGLLASCEIEKLPSELKEEREKKKQKEREQLGQPGRPELAKQTYRWTEYAYRNEVNCSQEDFELISKMIDISEANLRKAATETIYGTHKRLMKG